MEQTIKKAECVVTVSKSGRNIMARIPDSELGRINRGDIVKIVLLEKGSIEGEDKMKEIIHMAMLTPNGDRFKGTLQGYPFEFPLSQMIEDFGKVKVEKFLRSVSPKA